eukprot:Cvel_27331.t1-p1 / transcript=Cvel_27331.t1 / gene=Cvel_27331 / organism=Chromera_velia_CCMP2878 / gene_product=hypothetical protein / transcript_product=hypothetical protein / location=Cvel_scaffold3392:1-539(-) / protein_length=50 / sequence_SO=supercontig / SO=protein_coding / is_pseudo=false
MDNNHPRGRRPLESIRDGPPVSTRRLMPGVQREQRPPAPSQFGVRPMGVG